MSTRRNHIRRAIVDLNAAPRAAARFSRRLWAINALLILSVLIVGAV